MSEQYSYLLIPDRVDLAPHPKQVADFLQNLMALNGAPLEATFRVAKLSGALRRGLSALTGEEIYIPKREFTSSGSISDVENQLAGLEDYDVSMSGQGPAKMPPLSLRSYTRSEDLEFKGAYAYEVSCHLRAGVVSTCEPSFGMPCTPEKRNDIFRNPKTGAAIEVQNAACARFWIEFQFGKWLFPKIGDSLDLLRPSILAVASDIFRTSLAQGCMCA